MRARLGVCLVACATVLAALPAVAAPRTAAVVADVAGDANGANDQGLNYGGVGPPRDQTSLGNTAPQADLRALRLAPLRDRGRTTGIALTVTTTEPLQALGGSGRELVALVVVHVTSDCLFTIAVVTRSGRGPAAHLGSGGCSAPAVGGQLLTVQDARTVRVDLPYRLLPPDARPGRSVRVITMATRLSVSGSSSFFSLDTAYGGRGARLPR